MLRHYALGLAVTLALVACGGNRPINTMPRTTLAVENQSTLDMNIYLLANAQRVRLGTVHGLSTTRLTIPPSYVFGPTPLRFLADPIGSNRTPVSESITVSPGDEVRIIIPSRADMVHSAGLSMSRARRAPLH
ncbi:MAG: hypothetical protein ACT4P7_23200 [Gemmatimonadaceae bacterium]